MTILFLTEFFPSTDHLIFTGGVEARTYYLVNFAQKDFKVKVISRNQNQVAATTISIFSRLFYQFTAFFKALKTDFDLIEGSNITTYLPAYFVGRLKRKPTIAWIPDVLGKDWFQFGPVGLPGYLIEKISLRLNWDQIIALSQNTKNKLIQARINPEKIKVVYGGINPKEFKELKFVKSTTFSIICVARLVATKRIVDLVNAFALLNKKQPDVNLTIIGQGPKKPNLVNLTKKLNLTNKITFLENLTRSELIKTISQSHLFCLPSIVEGFGIATIEAMAAGLPAVLADIPINHEVTREGLGSIFFKPKDPSDLADKLNAIITDKELYLEKKHQATSLAITYNWESIYNQTKKIYENCYLS